ncbi:MAG: aromatic amino acid transporter [Cardiobacteriaceae bacterium]|nr:aromatic amino acid transporter [Cardiobacteriaceae bacterium]
MNKTFGTVLLVSGTMIGAGMLAMPLTSAGIGFAWTVVLLLVLWGLLTFSALLFVEVYQTVDFDAGIGTLAARYYGQAGRVLATTVMFVFLYALLSAYITGGGGIFMQAAQELGLVEVGLAEDAARRVHRAFIAGFTLFFGFFVVVSTSLLDGFNRVLFMVMLVALAVVIVVMLPAVRAENLLAMPLDGALLLSASPVFFTSFGFHGSIPSLNKYLRGDVRALRFAVVAGSLLTLAGYVLWQLATHGVLSQGQFTEILGRNPTLNGLVEASRAMTGSAAIARAVQVFSALALVTSFLGVALGLFDTIEDLLAKGLHVRANRLWLGVLTFLPPVLFAFFYPDFMAALRYAGQMFAFFAVVLPVGLVWKARRRFPGLPYRVAGGDAALWLALLRGGAGACIPFLTGAGWLPVVAG